jgi:Skp family chaperone for outer membrane proteins
MQLKTLLIAAIALAVPVAGVLPAAAQQRAPAPVILVVDTQKIMGEAKSMRTIRDQIDGVRNQFSAEIKAEEDALRRADQEMSQQRQVLSPEAFEQRRRDLQQRAAALQAKARTRRSQLDQALRTAVTTVRTRVIRLAQGSAQRRGANIVMQKSDLVYFDPSMEVTDEILRQLDAELPSVRVEVPRG